MAPAEEVGLVWFRRDLRLDDNPAWAAATSERNAVVPLYVIDPVLLASVGPYRRRQLIANLQALDFDLFEATGGRLLVRFGDPRRLVPEAMTVFSAGALYLNADVSPLARRRDDAVAAAIDVPMRSWFGSLVLPPGSVRTAKGSLSKVFSAFHKVWVKTEWDEWPDAGEAVVYDDPGEALPVLDGPAPFFEGPAEARRRLDELLAEVDSYGERHDDLGADATSQLSVDLRFGTISARAVVTAIGDGSPSRQLLVKQLARRDWYAHQLHDGPEMTGQEQVAKYRNIPWRNLPAQISAWKGGFTGFPIVDAGMRQLRETGRMPNEARVVASSFLVKDLLVDWRIGEKHFRHLLVDADPAQNVGNWQSVAGTGNDATPPDRVIDPVEHSRRHDPTGAYIRRWVPELAALDDEAIHAPWAADAEILAGAGVRLGRDYPDPIIDHTAARAGYLEALRGAGSPRRSRATAPAASPTPAAGDAPASTDAQPTDDARPTDVTSPPPEAGSVGAAPAGSVAAASGSGTDHGSVTASGTETPGVPAGFGTSPAPPAPAR